MEQCVSAEALHRSSFATTAVVLLAGAVNAVEGSEAVGLRGFVAEGSLVAFPERRYVYASRLGSFNWAGQGCSLLTTPIRCWR